MTKTKKQIQKKTKVKSEQNVSFENKLKVINVFSRDSTNIRLLFGNRQIRLAF